MIIHRSIARFIVFAEDSVLNTLRKISDNKARIIFVVSERGHLEGIVSDGDIRRWLVGQERIDLDQPIGPIANSGFVSAAIDDPPERVRALFSERIQYVPLVDGQRHLVAIAMRGASTLCIGEREIGAGHPVLTIAEIGNNHNGDTDLARRLIDRALWAGADCVKFQMRDMDSLYAHAEEDSEDLGLQYTLDLLKRFNLDREQLFELFDYCRERGILPLCTPWDLKSVEALRQWGMEAYKVASADLTNHGLLQAVAETGRPLLLSTGMSSEAEILESIGLLRNMGAPFVLLHCNCTYPAPFKDINLNYLSRLKEIGDCPVGYSGHERGYEIPLAAVSLGARVVEKHFTLDRNMEGNDHKVSLLPQEFRAMVDGIRRIEQGMGNGEGRRLTQGEMINREVLAKSLVAGGEIRAGQPILASMVQVVSPGKGLQPNRLKELIGRVARRDMRPGDPFYPSDIEDIYVECRGFRFRRPWGVPVRYHDYGKILARCPVDLLEFHLSYKDLEMDLKSCFDAPLDVGLVVHSPELFAGDHLMNLVADDPTYRDRSVAELQRVTDMTRSLKRWFPRTERPMIILNVGGFSKDGPLPKTARPALYARLLESFARVDAEGVELIPQTMPPFPWHFGGQRYHNLFADADEIAGFCTHNGYRVCLDVSHSKLACNHARSSFKAFLDEVAPHAAHLHIVDASGVDGEGLQIGEGDVDFLQLSEQLDRHCPRTSFIPEIWQGHKNGGEGFWIALERLEQWF